MPVAFGQQRGLLFLNVKDYGAIGDGITDDSAAIQAVINLLPATGGEIFFPSGTYLIGTPLNINAISSGLVLSGAGWSSVLMLKNGVNDYLVKQTAGSMVGARIASLKFDCNSTNQTAASGGILAYKWRRTLIEYCWFHNPWQAAVLFNGDVGDFGYQNRVANNYIEGGMNTTSGTNAYGEALRFINTDENMVYANHFENNGNPNDGTYGFHIYDQNGLTSYFGNSFVNGKGCIKLDGLQCRITSNMFDGNGGNLVQVNGSAAETIFTGNSAINIGFVATGGTANSINGIYLNATHCIIRNNYFESDASATPKTNSFVKIDTGATYSMIEGNTLNVKASSGTLTAPIYYVSGAPTGSRVRNNVGFDSVNSKAIFVTENHGAASITSGTTSIAVTHGLALTPTLDQIDVTPQTSLGSATTFWISNPTATQFTINVNVNPAATVTFGWRANVGY